MKKKLMAIMLATCMTLTPVLCFAEETETGKKTIDGFNGVEWGTSFDDYCEPVKDEKNFDSTPDRTVAGYEGSVAGLDAQVIASFEDEKLIAGYYIITVEHSNKTDFYRDYQNLKEKLSSLYGDPISDDEIWKDDLYKDTPSDWGMAIITGDLGCLTRWKDENGSGITLSLSGDNYDISSFAIVYEATADYAAESAANDTSGL